MTTITIARAGNGKIEWNYSSKLVFACSAVLLADITFYIHKHSKGGNPRFLRAWARFISR
jgi:hypothetical protein